MQELWVKMFNFAGLVFDRVPGRGAEPTVAGGFPGEVVHLSPENFISLGFLYRNPTQSLFHNISTLFF